VRLDTFRWQSRLSDLAVRHRVPGAALGISIGGDQLCVSAGVVNSITGVQVTDETLFQIGSLTKVWTTTVVMQLVDEGRLDLDAPIIEVLPELRLADPDATKQVTMRHLLTHTSGIDGDIFTDTGRGDDCLERYVALLVRAGQNLPLGAAFSYSNSGFVLAGRVIEKLTGLSWDVAMRERLFEPLGLHRTVTLPEEALRHHTAMGHSAAPGAAPEPAAVWGLPRSIGPAGLICASAGDVLTFARMHMSGGLAPDGTPVLRPASVAAMAARQLDLPVPHTSGDSRGLGWGRYGWDGHRLVGHDGNTVSQSAYLRVLPERDLAVALLTNAGEAHELYAALFTEVFAELAGVALPDPIAPATTPPHPDGSRHLGVYERAGARFEVTANGGGLRLRHTVTGPLASVVPDPEEDFDLVPIDASLYVFRAPDAHAWTPVTFATLPTGRPYLYCGSRATLRSS
jgi:CubicO group peptidase (beta-lactamase class C family)